MLAASGTIQARWRSNKLDGGATSSMEEQDEIHGRQPATAAARRGRMMRNLARWVVAAVPGRISCR
jgi:hypothetical protein